MLCPQRSSNSIAPMAQMMNMCALGIPLTTIPNVIPIMPRPHSLSNLQFVPPCGTMIRTQLRSTTTTALNLIPRRPTQDPYIHPTIEIRSGLGTYKGPYVAVALSGRKRKTYQICSSASCPAVGRSGAASCSRVQTNSKLRLNEDARQVKKQRKNDSLWFY